MRIVFFHSNKPREIELAKAFLAGAELHGHEIEFSELGTRFFPATCDLVCMVGVKSLKLWRMYKDWGIPVMMFDKGYSRHRKKGCWEYWRVSYNAHHPTLTTLQDFNYPSDRFERLGLEVKPWRAERANTPILFAGSSAKYHAFNRMSDPTSYAKRVIKALKRSTERPIIYRPKPSWRDAVPIEGTVYSSAKEPLEQIFDRCHVVVTHGSNTCFEAALNGIPSIVLGAGVMGPVSSRNLSDVEHPRIDGGRWQLFYNLAYHQWTLDEMRSGEAWKTIGEWVK